MSNIQIKGSSPPRRCEICHQADLFDANSNICSRCRNITLPPKNTSVKPDLQHYQEAPKVFTNLISSLGVISIITFLLVYFLGSKFFLQLAIPIYAIPLVSVIIVNYLFLEYVKTKMIEGIADNIHFIPAKIENFSLLDAYTLDKYSQSLISLGFQPIADITSYMEEGINVPGFARVFLHPTHQSIAEVSQLFPENEPIKPMRMTFISYFENNWTYGSTDREPDSVTYMIRRPKNLWTSHINKNVSQIFEDHLQKIATISKNLNSSIVPITSVEEYFFKETNNFREIRPNVKKLNMFIALFDGLFAEYFPKYEWLGDYKKASKK
ncbi:MAG: hypothetical protein HY819_04865 [Acidobacteria bacterium]|nr:hypothetical protein [Acidobacteriota bacterium]